MYCVCISVSAALKTVNKQLTVRGARDQCIEILMETFIREIQKTILEGVYEDECQLSKLRGCPHILRAIWENVRSFWRQAIALPYQRSEDVQDDYNTVEYGNGQGRRSRVLPYVCPRKKRDSFHSWLYLARIGRQRQFPEPTNININMMPFIVGKTFEDCRYSSKCLLLIIISSCILHRAKLFYKSELCLVTS